MSGIFALMLHAHIPYCRKSGTWPAGEEWLFEAMIGTYIPLIGSLRALHLEGIRPGAMIGLVPVLMEQLADEYMKDRFCEYMEDRIRRARGDIERFRGDPARQAVAGYWLETFEEHYRLWLNDFHRDILGTLRWLQEEQAVEVLTSAATHAFLPLLEHDSAIFSQVRTGVRTYERYFGRRPRGFWLPECAYRGPEYSGREQRMRAGIDDWLASEDIGYFFVESIGITKALLAENRREETSPATCRGYRLPSGVSVFGRNEATGKQVWSPDQGYPGDPFYLEFHQKDPESGLHYLRVTGAPEKLVYDVDAAGERVKAHAEHFVSLLENISCQADVLRGEPVIVSPYDCELFGHWWHEGVAWLEQVWRLLAQKSTVECRPLGEYIDRHGSGFSTITMEPSTWGLNADFTVWLNPEHGWIWPYISSSASQMEQVLEQANPVDVRDHRILRQMGRELLLMEGSDWPFLLYTLQAKEYANQRFHHHHQRFLKLVWAAKDLRDRGRISDHELSRMEDIDCPWQDLAYELFRHRGGPT